MNYMRKKLRSGNNETRNNSWLLGVTGAVPMHFCCAASSCSSNFWRFNLHRARPMASSLFVDWPNNVSFGNIKEFFPFIRFLQLYGKLWTIPCVRVRIRKRKKHLHGKFYLDIVMLNYRLFLPKILYFSGLSCYCRRWEYQRPYLIFPS